MRPDFVFPGMTIRCYARVCSTLSSRGSTQLSIEETWRFSWPQDDVRAQFRYGRPPFGATLLFGGARGCVTRFGRSLTRPCSGLLHFCKQPRGSVLAGAESGRGVRACSSRASSIFAPPQGQCGRQGIEW